MKITKKFLLAIMIFSTLFLGQFIIPENVIEVKADQDLWSQQTGLGTTDQPIADAFGGSTPRDPRLIIASVIKTFLGLLGIIFLYLIISAGYSWMTGGGDEEKITKAKDTLRTAIIGLIIILAAYAITNFIINSAISTTSNPAPAQVSQ